MIYKLRDYQENLIEKLRFSFRKHKKVLLVAPCGSGKTVVAADIINKYSSWGEKVWFVVHRKELQDQAINTFVKLGVPMENISVMMIQTLKNKLKSIDYVPDLIIADEAHHFTSKSYLSLVEKYPEINFLGLTATPTRMSGKPLGDVFDDLITEITATELIDKGFLADYDYYAPKIDIDFTKTKIVAGDYSKSEIDFLMNKPKIYGDIMSNFEKLAKNKKTIIYCSSIDYSSKIESVFKERGYNIRHFDGSTDRNERDQIIDDFRNNKIQILVNVDLVGEGFDIPDCECVLLLRPTQSLSLYIQQSTRCLRANGSKKAVIIDFVGNAYRHGMPTEDRDWALDKDHKCVNKKAEPELLVRQCTDCFKCYKGVSRRCPWCGNDNGKTRKQIEEDNKLELEKITKIKKLEAKREQGQANNFESLVALGHKRGYTNPTFWAKMIMKNRGK